MTTLLLTKPTGFEGFGPSILAREMRGQLRGVEIPADRNEARKVIRDRCPLVPAVYGWLDSQRRLNYVGKSKSLRNRLLSYFAANPADQKANRIRNNSEFIVWEPISDELLALIREQELIHRWRPEFNSMGQPTRMQPAFLCVAGSPVHNARLARRLSGKYSHAFGPISGTKHLSQAIVSLNQVFGLRDCPDKTKFEFANQRFLFENPASAKCIRHELGSCPGPCAGLCSARSYASLVDSAVSFLNGTSQETLRQIENEMNQAADRGAFEVAAIHRDRWTQLTWLDRRLDSIRRAQQELSGIFSVPARRNRTAWIVLRGGRICASMLRPDNAARGKSAEKQISDVALRSSDMPTNLLEMSLQLIVIAWFRKYPKLKESILNFESARQYCNDVDSIAVDSGSCLRRSA